MTCEHLNRIDDIANGIQCQLDSAKGTKIDKLYDICCLRYTRSFFSENVSEVWPRLGDIPYLRSVSDPYDAASPHHTWGPFTYNAARLARRRGAEDRAAPASACRRRTNDACCPSSARRRRRRETHRAPTTALRTAAALLLSRKTPLAPQLPFRSSRSS